MCRKRIKGQAMVEFALILPILILLICGIIDFGWIFGNQIIVNNATREAARHTAIHYDEYANDHAAAINAESIIVDKAQSLSDVNVDEPLKTGEEITIATQGTIPILTPFTSILLGNDYTMRSKSVMRIE